MTFPDAIQDVHPLTYGINLLIFGPNGIGKTPLSLTAPNVLTLDADHGMASAAWAPPPNGLRKTWRIEDWSDMDNAYDYLRNDGGTKTFDWVVLDGVTGFQELGLENIMRDKIDSGKAHRKLWAADKGEFGENMNRLKLWVRHMAALKINFIINAHEMLEDIENGMYMPSLIGRGMPAQICGYMDVIGHMWIAEKDGKTKQVIDFKARERYYARDRFKALPAQMPDPSIPKIQKLIEDAYPRKGASTTTAPSKKQASKAVASKAPAKKAPAKKAVAKKAAATK